MSDKQLDVLFRHFAKGGTTTTFEATVDFGICRLSERVRELVAKGWDITGKWETSSQGKHVKRYGMTPEQLARLGQCVERGAAGLGPVPGQPRPGATDFGGSLIEKSAGGRGPTSALEASTR